MAKQPLGIHRRGFRVGRRRFEQLVREVVDDIPEEFQPFLRDIDFVTADAAPEGMLGLYEGAGALGQSGWPARITIFRHPHETRSRNWPQLVEEVRRTIRHEIGHHFQMEEDELPY